MVTSKNVNKYLWLTSLIFITYLFIGSFIVSRDWLDLGYLILLYSFIVTVRLTCRNK